MLNRRRPSSPVFLEFNLPWRAIVVTAVIASTNVMLCYVIFFRSIVGSSVHNVETRQRKQVGRARRSQRTEDEVVLRDLSVPDLLRERVVPVVDVRVQPQLSQLARDLRRVLFLHRERGRTASERAKKNAHTRTHTKNRKKTSRSGERGRRRGDATDVGSGDRDDEDLPRR